MITNKNLKNKVTEIYLLFVLTLFILTFIPTTLLVMYFIYNQSEFLKEAYFLFSGIACFWGYMGIALIHNSRIKQ